MRGGILAGTEILTPRGYAAHDRDCPLTVCLLSRSGASTTARLAPRYGIGDDPVRLCFRNGAVLVLGGLQSLLLSTGREIRAEDAKNARVCSLEGEVAVTDISDVYVTATLFSYRQPCLISAEGILIPMH